MVCLDFHNIYLTHLGRMTHICVSKINIIDSDNGLSPGRCQAIIWTNAGIFLIEPLETNFSEMLIEIYTFSLKKMHVKMPSVKRRPFCPGGGELNFVVLCMKLGSVCVCLRLRGLAYSSMTCVSWSTSTNERKRIWLWWCDKKMAEEVLHQWKKTSQMLAWVSWFDLS